MSRSHRTGSPAIFLPDAAQTSAGLHQAMLDLLRHSRPYPSWTVVPWLPLIFFLFGTSLVSSGVSGAQLYPFGPSAGDQLLPPGDDVTLEVVLQVPVRFYGQQYQSIFVNTNGLLSFLTGLPKFFNEPFPLEYPVIAPLYSNVDTRAAGSVSYRESREPPLLAQLERKVADLYPGRPPFRPLAAFIATWENVGYFNSKGDKTNTFQAVISSDGTESYTELLYPTGGVSWLRAEPQGSSSLPDARAQAGLSAPGGKPATLRGSGTDRVHNLPVWSNSLTPGEYMFRVGNIEDTGQPEAPLRTIQQNEYGRESAGSCAEDGSLLCHKYSECLDQPEGGFCCRCQPGYIGDGRNCLDTGSHRMIGKINISLNGVEQHDLNMQAYIVTSDGRTYTAVSGVPPVVGYDMMLLTSLGSFVGFLFAKPIGEAPNGYQLTGGVVNHTVDITFDTRHHVTIHQRYTGLNIFEQVTMEAQVVGTLPAIPPYVKLNVLDFQEHFTRVAPGLFRSQSKHTIEVEGGSTERHEISVDQTIQFTEYCPSVHQGLRSLRLKSSRHFLNFEEKDNILRLASTSKISQNSEGQDPCVEGHVTCVANSTCLVEDDSFRCVCDPGFTATSDTQGSECVDINECEEGSAACHSSALCLNEVGSYSCHCLEGYTGDGRRCTPLEPPTEPNALCEGYGNQRSCICKPGYAQVPDDSDLGFKCEDIDECIMANPCHQNSYCYNSPGGFRCECAPGFTGDGFTCYEEEETGEGCAAVQCPGGGVCRENEEGRAECFCPEGYLGRPPYCQPAPVDTVTESVSLPAGESCREDSDCPEHFTCTGANSSSDGLGVCSCRPGYSQEGASCLPPTSETSFVRTCIRGSCWCPPGYTDNGELCVLSTTTTAPPPLRLPTCREQQNCNKNAKCIYVPTTRDYECKCNPGFEGDGYTCTEFEISCNIDSEICAMNAECRYDSTSDRHICICNEGYQGDGTTCYPSEEDCGGRCHPEAQCYSGECVCPEGWLGDGTRCERVIPGCDVLGNCHPDADCLYDSTESGYRCKCRQGFEGDGYGCEKIITCREEPRMCSLFAKCEYTPSGYECKCNEGHFGNGTYCKEINRQEEEFLLLNKGRSTIKLPFNPSSHNVGRLIQINGDQHAIGITIDCIEGRVYWSDIMNQKIKSSKYDGSDVQDFLVSGVKSPEGLAIDPENRVLYWTDSALHVISAARLDTREIRQIVSSGLVNPRGIAVHPYRRKLFWSDWNRKDPIIESSDLEGNNREVLVQKPKVSLPNSLAIDPDTEEICWADAGLKRIECYDFLRRVSRTVVQNCQYPFGLAITPEAYYWTDWSTGKVESSRKGSGTHTKSIPLPIGGDDKLYGLVAVTSRCTR